MLAPLLALAMTVQAPSQTPPPPAPFPPGCDIRVRAVDYRTGQVIPKAKIRLRDLRVAGTKASRNGKFRPTGPDGIACFDDKRPFSDGLFINANSLQFRDQGPEILISTRPQDVTVHLRHRRWWMYFRYFLIGD
jgi:hypothetical protein